MTENERYDFCKYVVKCFDEIFKNVDIINDAADENEVGWNFEFSFCRSVTYEDPETHYEYPYSIVVRSHSMGDSAYIRIHRGDEIDSFASPVANFEAVTPSISTRKQTAILAAREIREDLELWLKEDD